ncbi:rhodanese-like domain-containing protein [Pseudodesulfovibrio sp. zrk46]|uniref:rhodanese-like domain-containing protein n=1 Tax=Pseudodesulfovibrio sp. zrk46 TaxID=2725288 RepID=UPI001449E838|nr:rhodanese-like domain-containing protein [Pseudodesulfovibrio sp. zrk46]QJB56315.1 rhodanese-like domain-containing protein [Pseudodesulfovibrio sp. zrk46]
MRTLSALILVIALLILWDVAWWLGFGVSPLSPWTLKQMVNQDNAPVIIDVRTPAEFEAFHIPHAINVPFPATLAELAAASPDPTNPIVVVCMTGHRSPPVVRQLRKGGYTDVMNATWGMLAWKLFGGEVEAGK